MRSDEPRAPWRSCEALKALAGDLGARLIDSEVDGLAGGPGWLRLSFPATDRHDLLHLYLVVRAGATLIWDSPVILPDAFDRALGRVRQQDLSVTPYLRGARLTGIEVPPQDKLLRLIFRPPPNRAATVLSMQLFGARGNLALVDKGGKRLWSAHGSPHPLLLDPPRAEQYIEPRPDGPAADDARRLAPPLLGDVLAEDSAARLETLLNRALKTTGRLAENLRRDRDNARHGDHYRRQAETLAIHLGSLRRGLETIELSDAAGETISLQLDPALSPADNMAAFFRKARKADRGYQQISERLADSEKQLGILEALAAEIAVLPRRGEDALKQVLAWRQANEAVLKLYAKQDIIGRRLPKEAALPFRRYLIDGTWPVWVGRNNKENDELTHRAAAADDLWFHAQGVSGSHVILRTGGRPEQVPGRVLEKAASLAALNSKARNSSLVPVIHTLKKYVRKPRKSPAGTASCEREKSVMVSPEIADGVSED